MSHMNSLETFWLIKNKENHEETEEKLRKKIHQNIKPRGKNPKEK